MSSTSTALSARLLELWISCKTGSVLSTRTQPGKMASPVLVAISTPNLARVTEFIWWLRQIATVWWIAAFSLGGCFSRSKKLSILTALRSSVNVQNRDLWRKIKRWWKWRDEVKTFKTRMRLYFAKTLLLRYIHIKKIAVFSFLNQFFFFFLQVSENVLVLSH